ncbi:MAG: hypothetical protein ACLFVU_06655 [Phycisphaerae bacterium]
MYRRSEDVREEILRAKQHNVMRYAQRVREGLPLFEPQTSKGDDRSGKVSKQ